MDQWEDFNFLLEKEFKVEDVKKNKKHKKNLIKRYLKKVDRKKGESKAPKFLIYPKRLEKEIKHLSKEEILSFLESNSHKKEEWCIYSTDMQKSKIELKIKT